MPKPRKTENLVVLGKRVPECVHEKSEVAAERLTEILGGVLSTRFTPGEAINVGLDVLLEQMESPDFASQYIGRMMLLLQAQRADPKPPKKR